jgi:thioredoxin-like negative regulator of GroEL
MDCAPCRAAAPSLEAAATRQDVRYAQVDVGGRPDVARAYGIRTVPTIAVARRDGRVVGVWTGLPGGGAIEEAARRARGR